MAAQALLCWGNWAVQQPSWEHSSPARQGTQSQYERWTYAAQKPKFKPYSLRDNIPTNYYCLLPAVVRMQKGRRNCIQPCSCTDSRICNHSSSSLSQFPETRSTPPSEFSRPCLTEPVALKMETDIWFQPHQQAKGRKPGIH